MPRRQEDHDDEAFGETSRYTAHLDRGWSLLDRGDFQQARNSAHQAMKIRPDVPDGAMLMAAISLAESDPEGSLEWYERAIEADAEYVDAQLAAAQILLYDLDDPQRALVRAEVARELDEATLADHIDLGLLEVEALLGMNDQVAARERLASLGELSVLEQLLSPSSAQDELRTVLEDYIGEPYELEGDEWEPVVHRAVQQAMRVARLHLDLGTPAAAIPWLDALLRSFHQDPDIWYLANEAAHLAGEPVRAAHAALQVLQLDAAHPLPDWAPSPSDLHIKIVDLLLKCPEPQLRALATEPSFVILVNDAPPFEMCLEGVDPRVRALALAARKLGDAEPSATLTGLAVYHRNLVRLARDRAQLERELELAIFDELAVFYGFDDVRRERLGLPASEWAPLSSEARGRLEHDDRRKLANKPRPEPTVEVTEATVTEAIAEPPTTAEPPAPKRKKKAASKTKAASKKSEAAKPEAKRKKKAASKPSKVLDGKAKAKTDDKRPRKRPVGEPPEE